MSEPERAGAVTDEFIRLAKADERSLTPLQLIKLTYIAHGWMLALYQNLPGGNEVLRDKERDIIQQVYRVYGRLNDIQLGWCC